MGALRVLAVAVLLQSYALVTTAGPEKLVVYSAAVVAREQKSAIAATEADRNPVWKVGKFGTTPLTHREQKRSL